MMKGRRRMAPARDIDDYLASVPEDAREVLEDMRRTIAVAAPEAIESIGYGMPTFKYNGLLVAFAAFKNHCSFFPMSRTVMAAFKNELKRFDTAEGTIRFQIDKPLSATLVKKIVRARIQENDARLRDRESRRKRR